MGTSRRSNQGTGGNSTGGDGDSQFLRRVLRNGFGVLLLLLGIVGLVLPFLQGVLMIVAGLALIDVPQKRRAHEWLLRWRWYQALARRHAAVHERWRAWRAKRGEVSSNRRSR